MRKVNKDPFSNGTELMMFFEYNCDRCVKQSKYDEKKDKYTQYRCAIQREIELRMYSNEPIRQKTVQICDDYILRGKLCPYLKTERKKYTRKVKNQLEIQF